MSEMATIIISVFQLTKQTQQGKETCLRHSAKRRARTGIQVCLKFKSELLTTMIYCLPLCYTVLTFESDICLQFDTYKAIASSSMPHEGGGSGGGDKGRFCLECDCMMYA